MRERLERAGGLAYREAAPETPDGAPAVMLVHGFPESSYMWRHLLPALAEAGFRAVAPDLPGYGDSPPDRPGDWERHRDALERFRTELGVERTALVVHDWGGMIGLGWACEHPNAVSALVISDTGFFPDGEWHDLAKTMRTEGEGEQLMEAFTREAFFAALGQQSPGMDERALAEYWKGLADDERKQAALELYRSGDWEKMTQYDGCLAGLEVPALVLWGENDPYASTRLAHRFHDELPNSELQILEGSSHFIFDDRPEETAQAVAGFLSRTRA